MGKLSQVTMHAPLERLYTNYFDIADRLPPSLARDNSYISNRIFKTLSPADETTNYPRASKAQNTQAQSKQETPDNNPQEERYHCRAL